MPDEVTSHPLMIDLMGTLHTFTAVCVAGDIPRREDARQCWLLDWESVGIRIPWPEGFTPKQAVLEWARAQEQAK